MHLTTLSPHNSSVVLPHREDISNFNESEPLLVLIILLAMLCCTAGVLATMYVIRKNERLRRETKETGTIPVFRPTRPAYAPVCKPVALDFTPVCKPAHLERAPANKFFRPGSTPVCTPVLGTDTSSNRQEAV